MFDTPILFLVFNRPEYTEKVFARIREVKPRCLFVAADGPRKANTGDTEKCKQVRDIITTGIDWDCQVKTLFRDQNLGCGFGPAEGISWFFQHVEKGIILEDDCMPSLSFFSYCEQLLTEFQLDERIMMVSGFNPLGKWNENNVDYFYTDGWIWGWATWRRAWEKFDMKLGSYVQCRDNKYFMSLFEERSSGVNEMFDQAVEEKLDAWDYQWWYARMTNNGLSITPSLNLIQNIGFGEDATHTKWIFHPLKGMKAHELKFPLRQNSILIRDDLFRAEVGRKENTDRSLIKRLKSKFSRVYDLLQRKD